MLTSWQMISCFSDYYSVYERFKCRKSFLICENNIINIYKKCERINNIETGNFAQCYDRYIWADNSCNTGNIEIIKRNKFLIYFMILFFY